MIIRKAQREDAAGIAAVHVMAWKQTYKGIIDQNYLDQLNIEARLGLWNHSLMHQKENSPVFVAENDNRAIIGFASFGIERETNRETEGELYAIYLLDGYKGQKIGSKLFLAGVEEMIKLQYQTISVWVLADNPSRKFYERFSPVQIGSKMIKIGDGQHEEIAYQWTAPKQLSVKLKETK